jgi:hypothetical protein
MPKLWIPLAAALLPGGLLAYLLQRARRLLGWLPARVPRNLLDPQARAALLRIIAEVARYANLSEAERRKLAIQFVTRWLEQHHPPAARVPALTEHEVALLVELLFTWLRRHHPEKIVPPPLELNPPARRA